MKKNKEINLNHKLNPIVFNRQTRLIKQKCSNVVALINSGHFKFVDFKLFVIYSYMLLNRFNWSGVSEDSITRSLASFKLSRYEKDREYVKNISGRLGITNIREFFSINSNGNNLLYDLIKQGKISPVLYIKKFNIGLKEFSKTKYDVSEELNRFNKGIKIIKSI